jgi:EthD domain
LLWDHTDFIYSKSEHEQCQGIRFAFTAPELSRAYFHDYYRHPHGTMGCAGPGHVTTMRRYVQSHQIDAPELCTEQPRFDAVAELWFDSEADAIDFREHLVSVRYILDDEPKFIDMPNAQFLVVDEDVLYSFPKANTGLSDGDMMWSPDDRPISIKLLHFVSMSREAPWVMDEDEMLGRQIGALRHVRCWPRRTVHGDAPPYRGVREL